jgi:hypothetical protein
MAVVVSLLLALIVSVALLVVPVATEVSTSSLTGTTTRHLTLLESEGAGIIAVLAAPVLIAGVAVAVAGSGRRTRAVAWSIAAGLLWAWVIVASMSVGLFSIPSALAMTVAASMARPARESRPAPA